MQWLVEYTLDTYNYKEDLRNTQKAFYVHGSTKLNIKILIVSCTTKWLIFQNSVTFVTGSDCKTLAWLGWIIHSME